MIMSSGVSPNNPRHYSAWNNMQRKPAPQSKPPTPLLNSVAPSFKSHTLNNRTSNKSLGFSNNSHTAHRQTTLNNKLQHNQSSLGFNHLHNHNKSYSSKLQHEIYAPASIASPNELYYRRPTDIISPNDRMNNQAPTSLHYSTSANYNKNDNYQVKSKKDDTYGRRSSALGSLLERFGSLGRRRRSVSKTSQQQQVSDKNKLPAAEKIYAEGLQALNSNSEKRQLRIDNYETILSEGETFTLIDESSKQQKDFKLLVSTLINWINDELALQRLIVCELEDLFDGQVLCKLIEKLDNVKLDIIEVTQNADIQKIRLKLVLDTISRILSTKARWATVRWSYEGIHSKNLVEILYLLTTLAMFYRAPIKIPPDVRVTITVIHKHQGQFIKRSHDVQLTETEKHQVAIKDEERDAFDTLMDFAPEKLVLVKQSLIKFVNRHLEKVNINVSSEQNILEPDQFSDGILLVLLISSLEDYFVPLGYLFTSRQDQKQIYSNEVSNNKMPETAIKPTSYTNTQSIQKLHNVNFAFQLLEDAGIIIREKVRPEDIVNGDLKSVLRLLYAIFSRYS